LQGDDLLETIASSLLNVSNRKQPEIC